MIEKIVGATIVPSLQTLSWVQQVGWMAKPYTRQAQIGEDPVVMKDVIHPVANNVLIEDCTITSGLRILSTDKSYASLILIEQEGDVTQSLAANIPKRRGYNIEADIMLKVWLNNHQGTEHIAKGELRRLFSRGTYSQVKVEWPGISPEVAYDMFINKLRVQLVREVENPFSNYSFGSDQAQFNNDYAGFGMVLHVTGLIFPACFPEYPELDHTCAGPVEYVVDEFSNKIIG